MGKRVAIVVFQNLRYAPFLNFYETVLSKLNDVNYDVIYYNRDRSLSEPDTGKYIPISWIGKGTNQASKLEKIFNFLLYARRVRKVLLQRKYDYVIVLMTMPAVLLGDYLIRNYPKRYSLDIRDYTFEEYGIYRNAEKRVICGAQEVLISSEGFKHFLPRFQYTRIHNFNRVDNSFRDANKRKHLPGPGRPIKISYIGSISYERECIALIDLVASDSRFTFSFYGNENTSSKVSSYVRSLDCDRIQMEGQFRPSEKASIYKKTDMVFNCYGNDSLLVKYAISNKFYDSLEFRVPLLVSPNTSMEAETQGFSFALDLEKANDLDNLFHWYLEFDWQSYDKFAGQVINKAILENKHAEDVLVKNIKNIGCED